MKNTTLVIALAALAAGCGNPKNLDARFGETVTHVITEQTYNPAASHSNNPRPVTVLDGEKAAGTLEGYRAAVPRQENADSNVIKLKIED